MNQPINIELEKIVIANMLDYTEIIPECISKLNDDMFYSDESKSVYKAICEVYNSGVVVSYVSVEKKLNKSIFENYLVSDAVNWKSYLIELIDTYHRRLLFNKCLDTCRMISGGCELNDALANISDSLSNIETIEDYKKITEYVEQTITNAEQLAAGNIGVYASTGINSLNEKITGFRGSNLIILAARPGMGKTALALNFATSLSTKPVLFFSLEMSGNEIAERYLSQQTGIELESIKKGRLNADDFHHISIKKDSIDRQIYIDDKAAQKISNVRIKCHNFKRKHKEVGAIIFDYIQLADGKEKGGNRDQEIGNISRTLKIIAKELDCPVIALSQLSRESEKRSNKKPLLSDLRESGNIEQDADMVIFIYRDDYYGGDDGSSLIIAKNRHGKTGEVPVVFDGKHTTFKDIQQEYKPFNYKNHDSPF